jgi:hypothetical protein
MSGGANCRFVLDVDGRFLSDSWAIATYGAQRSREDHQGLGDGTADLANLSDRNSWSVGFNHPGREGAGHHQIITGVALRPNDVAAADAMALSARTTVGAVNRFYGQHYCHHLDKKLG